MKRIVVAIGRHSVEDVSRPREHAPCDGKGAYFVGTSSEVDCRSCNGTGVVDWDGFTYSGPDDVQLGDIVMMPPTPWHPAREGTIVGLTSTYDGPLKAITRVLERASKGE